MTTDKPAHCWIIEREAEFDRKAGWVLIYMRTCRKRASHDAKMFNDSSGGMFKYRVRRYKRVEG